MCSSWSFRPVSVIFPRFQAENETWKEASSLEENGSPSRFETGKKNSRPLVAVWLLLRDFLFGGVTIVSSSGRSSSCFFKQLPYAVSVPLSGDGSGATRMRPQVGSRVSLLLHTFPSHRKT